MGNMIGILSTVILVSTLATLIFAVGAYIMARRRRVVSAEPDLDEPPDAFPEPEDRLAPDPAAVARETPPPAPKPSPAPAVDSSPPPADGDTADAAEKPIFRRLTPQGDRPVARGETDDSREWRWE